MNSNIYIIIVIFLGIAVQFGQACFPPFSLFCSRKNILKLEESDFVGDINSLDPKLINKDTVDREKTMQCNDSKKASSYDSMSLKNNLMNLSQPMTLNL